MRTFAKCLSIAVTASSLTALFAALVLPFTPAAAWFGFVAPPLGVIGTIAFLVGAYLLCAEFLKPLAVRSKPSRKLAPDRHYTAA